MPTRGAAAAAAAAATTGADIAATVVATHSIAANTATLAGRYCSSDVGAKPGAVAATFPCHVLGAGVGVVQNHGGARQNVAPGAVCVGGR